MRLTLRFTTLLLALLVLGTAAACGSSDDADSADAARPDGSGSAGAVSPAPELPTVSPPTSKPGIPPPPGQGEAPQTVRGVVAEGVESGCLVLNSDSGPYLLIGGDQSLLQPGRTVVVVGVPDPGMVTTCQQGTPMKVTSVSPG